MFVGNARCLRGCLRVGDVALDEFLSAILYRADANNRRNLHERAAEHGRFEVFFIIFGECFDFQLEQCALHVRAGLEALKPLLDIGEETRF